MPSTTGVTAPGLHTFTKSVRSRGIPVESSIENLISLLRRRQIRGSKACATATAYLLRRVVESFKVTEIDRLIGRVQRVGQRLIEAQPKELAIGNVVRRVLGVIREEAEEDRDGETSGYSNAGAESQQRSPGENSPWLPGSPDFNSPNLLSNTLSQVETDHLSEGLDARAQRSPLLASQTSSVATPAPAVTSMFDLLSHPVSDADYLNSTSGSQHPEALPEVSNQVAPNTSTSKDLKAEVVEGIQEILDELSQADDQIAGYALEHIHSNEIILTHSSSITVQKFLLKAASKRRFTVIHAEAYPNEHDSTHVNIVGRGNSVPENGLGAEAFTKTLTAAGIVVILIPDSAVFALMSRVNKVILGAHAVLANGSLVATAGARAIAKAASVHSTHVVVLCAVYQLSPIYPFDPNSLMENGDPSKVIDYEDGDLVNRVDIENPLFDYVPENLVDLYITNVGGHARSYLYRIIQDHYRIEDIDLGNANEDR